jgi:hypothetical protein
VPAWARLASVAVRQCIPMWRSRPGLALRRVLHQLLRQTEGAIGSIVALLGVDLAIPDHTTFSRAVVARSTVALDGNVAPGKAGGASWRLRCIATRPSSAAAFTPGLCPIKRRKPKVACNVLNRMSSFGMPISVRIK